MSTSTSPLADTEPIPHLPAVSSPDPKPIREGIHERTVAMGLFGFFALLYLLTLCRTVYLGDSGEITTAIFTNGIIHPPGYPLLGLLGRIALVLVPFGEPTFRVGCVVALAGAGAVLMLYRFCRETGAGILPAITSAAMFGGSYVFWSQCVRVEVYSLHLLLVGTTLLAALRYGNTGSHKALFLSAAAFSLGLAHHLTIVLLLPALLLLAGKRLWIEPKAPQRIGAVIATILGIGPSFWLLLMYWASGEPMLNWSRPSTVDGLLRHVTARIYSGNLRMPTPERWVARLGETGQAAAETFLWIGLPLAIVGIFLLGRRQPRTMLGLLLTAIIIAVYCQFYIINDILAYFLPVWWALFVFLGITLERLTHLFRSPIVRDRLLPACLLLLPPVQIGRNFAACNLSPVTFVRDFARQKLEHVEPNGVLLLQGDNDAFPVQYARFVLGIRPDVTVIERGVFSSMYVQYDRDPSGWYFDVLRRQGTDIDVTFPPAPSERTPAFASDQLITLLRRLSRNRPLHTTFLDDREEEMRRKDQTQGGKTVSRVVHWMQSDLIPAPQGLVIRLYRRDEPVNIPKLITINKRLWDQVNLPDLSLQRFEGEMDRTYLADHYAVMLLQYGYLYELDRNPSEAAQIYTVAEQIAPTNEQVKTVWEKFRKKYRKVSSADSP
ncbi:MAG: DUF2723 domain-containing protein [Capsulimonadales bacterium]|nr:DUF2723 domain-containing protein [Capsulimonadales bacterium]